jgi:hypothetical protein
MKALLLAIVLLFPSIAFAAITHDVDATALVANAFAASPTKTFTSGATSASATLGVLTCALWQDVAGSGTVGSATYNGSTITKAVETRGGGMDSYTGYIFSPASGAKTVSVVVSGNIDAIKCQFSSYLGTSLTAPTTGSSVIGATPYTSMSTTVTAPTNGLTVATVAHFGTSALTIGGGQSSTFNNVTGSVGGAGGYIIGTGSQTPAWTTTSGSNDWALTAATFSAAASEGGGSVISGFFMLFGDWW